MNMNIKYDDWVYYSESWRWEDHIRTRTISPVVFWRNSDGHNIIYRRGLKIYPIIYTNPNNIYPFFEYIFKTKRYSDRGHLFISDNYSFQLPVENVIEIGLKDLQSANDNEETDEFFNILDFNITPYIYGNKVSMIEPSVAESFGSNDKLKYDCYRIYSEINLTPTSFTKYTPTNAPSTISLLGFLTTNQFHEVNVSSIRASGAKMIGTGNRYANPTTIDILYDINDFYTFFEIRNWEIPEVFQYRELQFFNFSFFDFIWVDDSTLISRPSTSNMLSNHGKMESGVVISSMAIFNTMDNSIVSSPPIFSFNDDTLVSIKSNTLFELELDEPTSINIINFSNDINMKEVLMPVNYYFRREDMIMLDGITFSKVAPDLTKYIFEIENQKISANLDNKNNTELPVITGCFPMKYIADENYYIQEDGIKSEKYEGFNLLTLDVGRIFDEGFNDESFIHHGSNFTIEMQDTESVSTDVSFHLEGNPINHPFYLYNYNNDGESVDRWQDYQTYRILLPYKDNLVRFEDETDEEYEERLNIFDCKKYLNYTADGDSCTYLDVFNEDTNIIPISQSSENQFDKILEFIKNSISEDLTKEKFSFENSEQKFSKFDEIELNSFGFYCDIPSEYFDIFSSNYTLRRRPLSEYILEDWDLFEENTADGNYFRNLQRVDLFNIMKDKTTTHYFKWFRYKYAISITYKIVNLGGTGVVDSQNFNDINISLSEHEFNNITSCPYIVNVTIPSDTGNKFSYFQVFVNEIRLTPIDITEVYSLSVNDMLFTIPKANFLSSNNVYFYGNDFVYNLILEREKDENGNLVDKKMTRKKYTILLGNFDTLDFQLVANFENLVEMIEARTLRLEVEEDEFVF